MADWNQNCTIYIIRISYGVFHFYMGDAKPTNDVVAQWNISTTKALLIKDKVFETYGRYKPPGRRFKPDCFRTNNINTVSKFIEGLISTESPLVTIYVTDEGKITVQKPKEICFARKVTEEMANKILSTVKTEGSTMDVVTKVIKEIRGG